MNQNLLNEFVKQIKQILEEIDAANEIRDTDAVKYWTEKLQKTSTELNLQLWKKKI